VCVCVRKRKSKRARAVGVGGGVGGSRKERHYQAELPRGRYFPIAAYHIKFTAPLIGKWSTPPLLDYRLRSTCLPPTISIPYSRVRRLSEVCAPRESYRVRALSITSLIALTPGSQ
jgi:hypothetical protein